MSLVDSNSPHDSPHHSESSFIETQNRKQKSSLALSGRIVGALNQGMTSLGEKIGKYTPEEVGRRKTYFKPLSNVSHCCNS